MLIRTLSILVLMAMTSCAEKDEISEDQQSQLILEFASQLEQKETNYKHNYERD